MMSRMYCCLDDPLSRIETMGGVDDQFPSMPIPPYLLRSHRHLPPLPTTSHEIHASQGERPMAKDNKSLGKFNLDGVSCMLCVSATD